MHYTIEFDLKINNYIIRLNWPKVIINSLKCLCIKPATIISQIIIFTYILYTT